MGATQRNHRHERKKVLVLGTDDRVILAVVRSLGRQGLEVHLGWCAPTSIASRSRYVSQLHTIPAFTPDSDSWIEELRSLMTREQFDLVIPCNDSTLVPLVSNRNAFSEFPCIYLLPDDVFNIVSDKFNTYELALQLGVKVPPGRIVDGSADAHELANEFGLPLVFKPQATITTRDVALSNIVRKAYTVEQAQAFLDGLGVNRVLVQQQFTGRGAGVEMLVDRGEVLFAFQHRRLHETVEWGSTYRESVPVDGELLDAAQRMMRAIGYTGVAMAEFIVNPQAGQWVFLEINGRFWGSLPLAVAAGADFPYYLFRLLVDGSRETPGTYRLGVRCRNLLLDFRWLKDRARRPGVGRLRGILEMVGEMLSIPLRGDHLDSFSIDDPLPLVCEVTTFAGMFLQKLRKKVQSTLRPVAVPPRPA